MRLPSDCQTMMELRAEIDALDAQLVSLLAQRAGYIDRAIVLKKREGLPANIPDRVAEVIGRVRSRAESEGLDSELVETLWRALIDWSIAREEKILGQSEGRGDERGTDQEGAGR